MAGIIVGGLFGYGLALAGFFVFRWADHAYVAEQPPHPEPVRKAA